MCIFETVVLERFRMVVKQEGQDISGVSRDLQVVVLLGKRDSLGLLRQLVDRWLTTGKKGRT